MHEQFIEPTKAFADIIIPNDKYNTVAIDVVRAVINQKFYKLVVILKHTIIRAISAPLQSFSR
jgi:uridine kinase